MNPVAFILFACFALSFALTKAADPEWRQRGSALTGIESGDRAGWSVALSGDGSTVVAGSVWSGNRSGQVRAFRYALGEWVQMGSPLAGDNRMDQFGYSVATSEDGNTIVAGSPEGYVKAFKWDSWALEWSAVGSVIWVTNGDGSVSGLGSSLAVSSEGDVIAVGAPTYSLTGAVAVYKLAAGEWQLAGSPILGDRSGNQFGHAVDLSADGATLVVGSGYNDSLRGGPVRVYTFADGDWVMLGEPILPVHSDDGSGWSVSLDRDGAILAIGSPYAGRVPMGGVRLYKYADGWSWIGTFDGTDVDSAFGYSVDLSSDGSSLIIGSNAGSAIVVQFDGEEWSWVGEVLQSSQNNDSFGSSVTIADNGNYIAVGAHRANIGENNSVGQVVTYGLFEPPPDFEGQRATDPPSEEPSEHPTAPPTASPTTAPTETPTTRPTAAPTASPSGAPTVYPTLTPTPLATRGNSNNLCVSEGSECLWHGPCCPGLKCDPEYNAWMCKPCSEKNELCIKTADCCTGFYCEKEGEPGDEGSCKPKF